MIQASPLCMLVHVHTQAVCKGVGNSPLLLVHSHDFSSAEGVKEKEVFLSRREDRKDSSSSLAETTGFFSTTVLCSGGGGGLTETVTGQAMDVEDDPIPPQER